MAQVGFTPFTRKPAIGRRSGSVLLGPTIGGGAEPHRLICSREQLLRVIGARTAPSSAAAYVRFARFATKLFVAAVRRLAPTGDITRCSTRHCWKVWLMDRSCLHKRPQNRARSHRCRHRRRPGLRPNHMPSAAKS